MTIPSKRPASSQSEHYERAPSIDVFPGQVLKARIWNFAQYDYAEFDEQQVKDAVRSQPKDFAIPTALYLGLGGDPSHYNVSPLRKLVLAGEKGFTIELTLRADSAKPNIVIRRKYNSERNQSEWTVDGATSTITRVCQLVDSFTDFD